jgi:thiol-disulfide isomerase/thioredoxin
MSNPGGPAKYWRLAGALLVALLGSWAGFRAYSSLAPRTLGVGDPATNGAGALPSEAVRLSDEELPAPPRIPERLPDFSLADRSGKPTSIAKWRGKSLIINFWATWCAPCRHEIPLLQALDSEWRDRGVEVVGIAVDRRENVLAYADKLKISYPLLMGEDDALEVVTAFGVESPAFPFSVFTDSRGEVVTLYVGELHRAQADFILSVVHQLDQNQLPLAQARSSIAAGLRSLGREPRV